MYPLCLMLLLLFERFYLSQCVLHLPLNNSQLQNTLSNPSMSLTVVNVSKDELTFTEPIYSNDEVLLLQQMLQTDEFGTIDQNGDNFEGKL